MTEKFDNFFMIFVIYLQREELNLKTLKNSVTGKYLFYDDISEIFSVNWLWWEFDVMQEIERVGWLNFHLGNDR